MMPFNMSPQQILQQAMRMNPNIANNSQVQQYIQVLMSGDARKGQELAQNICGSFGVTPEQGVQQCQQYLSNMMNQRNFRGG